MDTTEGHRDFNTGAGMALQCLALDERVHRHSGLLLLLAGKYVWWLTAEEAMEYPSRVIAQVMNIGVFDDVARLLGAIGEDGLRVVLRRAEAGQFNGRSWHYWHYRLGLAQPNQVPPLPTKYIPVTS